ncbi:MAG: GAF domain-containing protein [Synechococcaceae cyanobacterium RL_1_2]|nr:GAF domain-containing protein [Synechococcaceae cyanobacterium RL_1_2]
MMGSQEQLFEMIFEHTPLGMFTLDRRGYFLRVNRQFCAMVGYSRGDIIDRIGSYQNLIVDGNNEDLQELHELQDVTGLAQEPPPLGTNNKLIRHLRCQGGQELAVHLTLMGLGQAPQEPNINDGLGDLIWGIIEHHGTDDLGDQTLADNLPQYIYRLDLEGKLTYGNRAFLDSIGLNLTTAMGKTYAELYPPAIADRYQTLYRQTIEQGEPKETVEAYPRNGDGDYHQMKLTNIPLKNEQQQIIGMQGIFWDISKIKQTEKILRQQLKREIFLSGITERIRKSLNLEEILTTSVGDIREILEVDRVIICSALPENLGICHQESVKPPWPSMKGQTLPLTNLDDGQNQSYHHGQMGIVEDTTATAWPLDYAAFVEEYQIKAEMTASHLVGDKLWGLLMAHQCGQTRSWHPFEIDLLQQLATQTAIAIHQSQLYETTKQQAQREKLLNEVIESIRHSLSLHKILPRAAQAILNAFSAKLTLVGICDCKQKTLQTFVTAVPPTQQDMPNEVLATIHDFYLKDIYTSDQILALSNLQELNPPPSPELRAQLHQYELGSVLAIAIKFESEVCGVLSIYHHDGYRWSENDEILIKELANQLAVAIQQGQLYAQLQEANAELKKQVSLDGRNPRWQIVGVLINFLTRNGDDVPGKNNPYP